MTNIEQMIYSSVVVFIVILNVVAWAKWQRTKRNEKNGGEVERPLYSLQLKAKQRWISTICYSCLLIAPVFISIGIQYAVGTLPYLLLVSAGFISMTVYFVYVAVAWLTRTRRKQSEAQQLRHELIQQEMTMQERIDFHESEK